MTVVPVVDVVYVVYVCFPVLLTFINCWNVNWATRVQSIFTVTKVFALAIVIIIGFIQLGKGQLAFGRVFNQSISRESKQNRQVF